MRLPPRLATAVALAGMAAHGRNERRAVLLISAGAAADESELPPRATREYLRALGVPLYVWSLAAEPPDREWGEFVELGDPATPLKTARRLGEAAGRLQRDLKKQRVVWLVGRHLPNRIELGPEARGIALAAAEP